MCQKFDDKSTACIFLGYYPGCNYKLCDPSTGTVSKNREVIFDEGSIHHVSVSPSAGEHMELVDVVEADVAIRHSSHHSVPSACLQDSHEFLN
jgi:hypothetical protein